MASNWNHTNFRMYSNKGNRLVGYGLTGLSQGINTGINTFKDAIDCASKEEDCHEVNDTDVQDAIAEALVAELIATAKELGVTELLGERL